MIQYKKFILTLFLILTGLISLAHGQTSIIDHSYGDENKTTVNLLSLVGQLPSSGYLPVRLTLKNPTKTSKTWKLKFKSSSVFDNHSSWRSYRNNRTPPNLTSIFKYSCPAESTKTYDILVPLTSCIFDPLGSPRDSSSSHLSAELISDGNEIMGEMYKKHSSDTPVVLLSSQLSILHGYKFNALKPSTPKSSISYSTYGTDFTTEFNPSKMSEDWRAYSGFDSMILTDNDWLKIPASAQNALLEWNRLGGKILIYTLNPASNLKSLNIDESNDSQAKTSITRSFGSIILKPLANIKSLDVAKTHKLINNPKTNNSKSSELSKHYNGNPNSLSAWSLQKALGKLSFSPFFLILILIAFGIIVGPINLFIFAKAGKRHRLFITTPIIALAASLILVLLIIIQDGFGGHGQRVQLMEVRADGAENKAYVWQEQVARTGVILDSSFETSSPAVISPVPISPSRLSRVTLQNGGGTCSYKAKHGENGLVASGDWFQSRSVHGHFLEGIISTRSRITLKSNQGAPVINSSFDYLIQTIIFRDNKDKLWTTSNVKAGETKKLTPCSPIDALKIITEKNQNMSKKLQNKLSTLSKRKNHFIALTNEAPAIETLDSIKWINTESIITGPVVK